MDGLFPGDHPLRVAQELQVLAPETIVTGEGIMEGSYPNRLRVWDRPAPVLLPEPLEPTEEGWAGGAVLAASESPAAAAQLFARETMQSHPRSSQHLPAEAEPFTLQWFLSIENQRHGRHGRWLPRLLEFAKHSGETLLGLGPGLGTDWLQYARHGAAVVVCNSSASQLALVRRNFELRGLAGRFLHCSPAVLPLDSASIDVACLSDLVHGLADPQSVIVETYRVLKPGGKVLVVTAARYDVDFWCRRWLFWPGWFRRRGMGPELCQRRFSARGLRRLFGQFVDHRVHKRQLRRSEVPHLLRVLPLPLLERWMGRVLVLKAFKPLYSARPAQAAA
jgi:ubiquinone/menaquinone biosynthesis C-methylase UbiE